MAAYIIANLQIHDPSWVKDYLPPVDALVKKHGGRYLASSREAERLEGDSPTPSVLVIIEFPDMAAARAFHTDEAYQPHRKARQAGSSGDLWLLDGM